MKKPVLIATAISASLLVLFLWARIESAGPNTAKAGSSSEGDRLAAWIASHPQQATAAPSLSEADKIAGRKLYAKVIDQQMLDMGIESKTYVRGPKAQVMVIEDVLAGRVRANAISKNSTLFSQLKDIGFTRLEYTNGLEGDLYVRWHWDLN